MPETGAEQLRVTAGDDATDQIHRVLHPRWAALPIGGRHCCMMRPGHDDRIKAI